MANAPKRPVSQAAGGGSVPRGSKITGFLSRLTRLEEPHLASALMLIV